MVLLVQLQHFATLGSILFARADQGYPVHTLAQHSEHVAAEEAETGHTMRILVTVPIKPIEPIPKLQNAETAPIKQIKPILADSPGPESKTPTGLVLLV